MSFFASARSVSPGTEESLLFSKRLIPTALGAAALLACNGELGTVGGAQPQPDGALPPDAAPGEMPIDPQAPPPPTDGIYRDHNGNALCDSALEDCSVFAPGGYQITSAPMARLNREQYNRTVRDVLGSQLRPADSFPLDETALGFDTIAAVQGLQPTHVDRYMSAARQLADEFMARGPGDPVRDHFIACDLSSGAECQLSTIRALANELWRRPVADDELTAFTALAANQPTPAQGLHAALRALLVSAPFIFRVEMDPDPNSDVPHPVSAHELATRLSYLITGSSPDVQLRAAADAGTLLETETLVAEFQRLVAAPEQAQVVIDTFGAQWLNINAMDRAEPFREMFPDFDEELRAAMIAESKLFLLDFLNNDRALPGLFNAEFTYANQRLAQHYGLPETMSEELVEVSTAGTPRIGLLSHGSFLTATSNPTRTSPVKRGLFVLERLLCQAPPPPPADVDTDIEPNPEAGELSLRERLLAHQEKGPACFGCHQVMDAIGLGLENFDAIGSYREEDEFGAIDATAELPSADGSSPTPFDGAAELAQILAQDERTVHCAVERLLEYGLGRALSSADQNMEYVVATTAKVNGESLRDALEALVVSETFRFRRPGLALEGE